MLAVAVLGERGWTPLSHKFAFLACFLKHSLFWPVFFNLHFLVLFFQIFAYGAKTLPKIRAV